MITQSLLYHSSNASSDINWSEITPPPYSYYSCCNTNLTLAEQKPAAVMAAKVIPSCQHLVSNSEQGLKTEGNCKVLASISLDTFFIKNMRKLTLLYPLLFINIHKGTKYPISVHHNLQPANLKGYTARCFR